MQENPAMVQQLLSNPETMEAYMQIMSGYMRLMRSNPGAVGGMLGLALVYELQWGLVTP